MIDYVSHEPPCGWLKLQNLFIEKSAYLTTHVDWDNETVNFESLAQIIDYGKRALRECLERKHETDALKAQRDELLEALELLIDDLALRAKLRGDECLDVSDGRLYKAQKAIAKAKGEV